MATATATMPKSVFTRGAVGGAVGRDTFYPHPDDFDYDDGIARVPNADLREALEDVRLWRNMSGPFATVEETMRSLLED